MENEVIKLATTLRHILNVVDGDIEILNECNETLARLQGTGVWAVSPIRILDKELLEREVIRCENGDVMTIVVKGDEDVI